MFIFLPINGLLLLLWAVLRKRIFGKILGLIWLFCLTVMLVIQFVRHDTPKITLTQSDYVGKYVIKRNLYPGIQADWQYTHFRFQITSDDSLLFYLTDHVKILKTFRGTIKTVAPYYSARLIINMKQPTHHI